MNELQIAIDLLKAIETMYPTGADLKPLVAAIRSFLFSIDVPGVPSKEWLIESHKSTLN